MIERLKNEEIIGYGCIVTTSIRQKNKKELEKRLKETKVYDLISHMMNPDNIVIDVITGSYRKRKQLLEIIDTFEHNLLLRRNPIGCIVIPSISDLGTTISEIQENYSMLCDKDVGVLVLDNEELSTVDYSWHYCKNPIDVIGNIEKMSVSSIPSRQGRKKKDLIVTDEFKQLYWYYENYFVPENIVYYQANTLVGKITKVAFNQLCDEYERSAEYKTDELEQEQLYQISTKPKRHGKAPAEIAELHTGTDIDQSVVEAICIQLSISPITFQRYILKGVGRKSMAKAAFAYKRQDIIDALTPEK